MTSNLYLHKNILEDIYTLKCTCYRIQNRLQGYASRQTFCEKKKTLMVNFNIHILNCDLDKDIAAFADVLYSSSYYPTINTPTRITAISYIY